MQAGDPKPIVTFLKLLANFIIVVALYYIFLKLFVWIFPISFVVVIWTYTYKKKWRDSLPVMVRTLYESIYNFDCYSHREFRTLWNTIFLKKEENGYVFGKVGESLSSALGRNQRDHYKNLTIIAWAVIYILWAIDWSKWGKGGHCIASIGK